MATEIRMQADDFFNAYRVLSESNESAIDKLSKLAGKPLVSDKAFGSFPTMSPSVVCLAFAVELYIKDLYHALKIKPPRGPDGHNILKLYEGLPEQIRQEIFAHNSISGNPFITRGSVFSSKKFTRSYRDKIEAIRHMPYDDMPPIDRAIIMRCLSAHYPGLPGPYQRMML